MASFNAWNFNTNMAKPFVDLWYRINYNLDKCNLNLVTYVDDNRGILSKIKLLGSKFDFLIIICNSKTVLNYCNWLILGKYKKLIGVNRNHRLAKFIKLKIRDLYGETIMMIPRGDSMVNDSIRDELESHPEITIENTTQFYDLVVFNLNLDNLVTC